MNHVRYYRYCIATAAVAFLVTAAYLAIYVADPRLAREIGTAYLIFIVTVAVMVELVSSIRGRSK